MSKLAAGPRSGYAVVVARREARTTLWWGEADNGDDVVAVRDGRVITWASPEDCYAEATNEGWDCADDQPTYMDLTPAIEWHARQKRAIDAEAALNSWNLAADVARSVRMPWGDRGSIPDACHTKLTTACVPWLAGLDAYTPRWTVAEERYLRRRLGAAFTLFAQQLSAPATRRP